MPAKQPEQKTDPLLLFKAALEDLAVVGGFSNHVSMELAGRPTTRAGEYASMVHGKMCATARSIGAICESPMFDHSAIMGLSRVMMDGLTMFCYLHEPVSAEQWYLRDAVLLLHDTVTRIKLARSCDSKESYSNLSNGRLETEKRIRSNRFFSELPEAQQTGIMTGEQMFIGGMRAAACRSAGWHKDKFTSLYSYFSAHLHVAPMSYTRMRAQGIDFLKPSATQYGLLGLPIVVATACLRRATLRLLRADPPMIGKFHKGLLEDLTARDEDCGVFMDDTALNT